MSPLSIENEIKSLEREISGEKQDHEKSSGKNGEKQYDEKKYEKLEKDTNVEGLHHRRGSEAVFLPKEVTMESNLKSRIDILQDRQAEEMKRQCSALILTQAEMESTMKKVNIFTCFDLCTYKCFPCMGGYSGG